MMPSTIRAASLLGLAACVGCTTAGRPPAEDRPSSAGTEVAVGVPPGSDLGKLQGRWRITSIEMPGRVVRPGDWSPWAFLFKGAFASETFFRADRTGTVGYSDSRFEVDEARDPKHITIHADDGKLTFRGIYALDGDALTMCVNGDGKSELRPDAFATKKGTPIIITRLRRVTPKQ